MNINSSSSDRDPLERLAAEFLDRRRRGENPSPSGYADQYPQWADQILEFFPALELMEGLKPGSRDQTASLPARAGTAVAPQLQQLGEYRILREIGRGGMGVVYEAVQESLGRRVALKILPLHGRIDPVQMERFQLESRSAARLHHTGIVPDYGVGEHGGVHYYAMQYIQGHGLDVILEDLRRLRGGPAVLPPLTGGTVGIVDTGSMAVARSLLTGRFSGPRPDRNLGTHTTTSPDDKTCSKASAADPPAAAASISSVLSQSTESAYYRAVARLGIQVAQALAHAHGQGVLHRDIKPSNLLLDVDGHVWITDFGLAKLEGSVGPTQTGDIVGTLRYMAPERFEGWSDRRSDLYGLGMTLYELLTLRPAFEAGSRAKLIDQVIHDPQPSPRKHDVRVPRDLETIVMKVIAKEPGERYATAEALSADLENFVTDRPILARRSSLPERTWRWCRRNRPAAALLGVTGLAVLTLVGLGVALFYQSRLRAAYSEVNLQRSIAQVALDNERTFLYTNRVIFAHRELDDHNPERTEELLEECPEERRGWEWNYLNRQCHTELRSLTRHGGASVAYNPDGRLILSADFDYAVRIWDSTTSRLIQTWDRSRNGVWGLAISPDGRRVASASGSVSDPDPVLIRDLESGHVLLSIDARTGKHSGIAFSVDGRRVVIAGGELAGGHSYVQVHDSRTGKKLTTISPLDEPAYSPSFSPDGTLIMATVGSIDSFDSADNINRVVVWDVETGQERFSLRDHRAPAMFACFSPDGKTIVTGGYDSVVRLYDAANGRLRHELAGHRNCVNQLAFSPDGSRLASTSDDNTVMFWDAAAGKHLFTLSGHRGGIYGLAYHPDGHELATSGYDGVIKVWDATISKDSQTLRAPVPPGRVACLAFNHRGDLLAAACADRTVKLWEMPSGRFKGTLSGHSQPVQAVAFSPDDRWIASAAGDWRNTDQAGEVDLWDAGTRRLVYALKAHHGGACTVAFSPDGSRLASGGGETFARDSQILFWDVAACRPLGSIDCPDGGIRSLALSPNGRAITAAAGKLARTWDVETGAAGVTFAGHQKLVERIAYTTDGAWLATGSIELSIRLWNATTGEEIGRLRGHGYAVRGLVFSPDGRRIASGGGDKTLKIWDAQNRQELLTLKGHDTYVNSVAFSPDGHRIATGDQQGIIKVWDGTPVSRAAQ